MSITKFGTPNYDDLCSLARERAGLGDQGTVLLIVIHNQQGVEYTAQADDRTIASLDGVLDYVGNRIIIDSGMPEEAR